MEANRIAIFAQCGADGTSRMREYVSALRVPEGCEVDFEEVPFTEHIAAAYQNAMKASSAKYKIYLTEGSVLLHEDILADMLAVFRSDDSIGLMGILGVKQLSASALFARSFPIEGGRVLFWDGTHFDGVPPAADVTDVMAISRECIATQYDVAWRADLFAKDCFWAEAQCAEFRRRGYRTVIPRQEEEWLLAVGKSPDADEPSRRTFLDAYSAGLYPLVSIIIPTFERPHYFRLALESVLAQTYRNLDIFITDNSHDEKTANMMARDFAGDPRIHYEHHADFDAAGNWMRAMSYDNPNAAYVNWLMDDDLFLPQKIECMIEYFLQNPDVSLVTSYRQRIDGEGKLLVDSPDTEPFVSSTQKLDGKMVGREMLRRCTNFIGEPTTALIKKACMNGTRLGWTGREGKYLISDFPTWLNQMEHGNLVYIREALSQFRYHDGNDSARPQTLLCGSICWAMMIQEAIGRGVFLADETVRREAIVKWLYDASFTMKLMTPYPQVWAMEICKDYYTVFSAMADALGHGLQPHFEMDTRVDL